MLIAMPQTVSMNQVEIWIRSRDIEIVIKITPQTHIFHIVF